MVLGDAAAVLVWVETCTGPRAARDRCLLASGWVQAVLDVALTASDPHGKKMREQGIAQTDLPHGRGEPNLGRAAHSWRAEHARLHSFRADRVALDEGSTEARRAGKAMGGVSEQPSGSHRGNGFLYGADAHLRRSLLLFRYCA